MKKPSVEGLIVYAGAVIGIAFAIGGMRNGLRFAAPYATKEIAAVSTQVQELEQKVEGMEKQKAEIEAAIEKQKAEDTDLQKSIEERRVQYDEASLELNDLAEYQQALFDMQDYIRPLKLVADMEVYWGYDFERAGDLSSDTNLMNSLNGMFGNIVTNLFVKSANDSKNKILDMVGQFNNSVEPYVNSNMKLIEDAKAIVYEIEFCSQLLEYPEDQNELLMNLRLIKEYFGGVPAPEFYQERIKALMPGLYQGYKQFQLILGAYSVAFQNSDAHSVKSMDYALYDFKQAIDVYSTEFDSEWYDQCMKVAEENYYPIVNAYKALVDVCMEHKDEMKELKNEVFRVTSDDYGDCDISVYYKKIDSETIFLCVEEQTAEGRKLGKFYYDFQGWPIYYYSYLDQTEALFLSDGFDRYLDGEKVKDGSSESEKAATFYGKSSYLRHLLLKDREELQIWYRSDRFSK